MTNYPLSAVRALALHTQGLTSPNQVSARPASAEILRTIEQLGCVQIDSLNLVRRSHYLALWSRLGDYHPADFDSLVYSSEHRALFEGWQRVASIIPLKDYRYQLPRILRMRQNPSEGFLRWYNKEGLELMTVTLERIHNEGGLKAADFEYHGPKRGSWWDWKPAKTALEYLFALGQVMISDRVHFQRVYDLTERVLPEWVDTSPPTMEERDRFWLEQASLAQGISQPNQVISYNYLTGGQSRLVLKALIQERVLVPVETLTAGGDSQPFLVHRDNLGLLQQAADGAIQARRTTFLSPFDSLFWARGRDMQLWNYHSFLEAYTPMAKRIYGYFCLSILHNDRLVGRFDPKLERKEGRLRLKALYLEAGVPPDDELVKDVAVAMRDFMAFHQAKELVIEKSQPAEFGDKLFKTL